MKQTVSTFSLRTAIFLIAFFIFAPFTNIRAVEMVDIDYNNELIKVNENYDNILDYKESKRCIAFTDKDHLNCDVYEDTITYLYKTQIDAPINTINKNTVQLSQSSFQIFAGDTFYQDEQTRAWKQTDYGIIEKNDFQIIQNDKLKTIDEISFLNNPFKIYKANAQIWGHAEDGRINNSPGSATWSIMRDATTGTAVVAGNSSGGLGTSKSSSGYFQGIRHYFPFSLAGIDDCISSSTFSFFTGTVINQDNDGNDFITLTDNSAGLTLETTDWDATTFTEYISSGTRLDYGSAASKRVAMLLNSSAIDDMVVEDYFYLMMIEGHDFLNDPYGGANNTYNDVIIYHAEDPGLTRDPYLLIETSDCEEEEEEATSTVPADLTEMPTLPLIDDLAVVTGRTDHYESTTTAPDWIEYHYYRIPFFLWFIFWSVVSLILTYLIIEMKRILRKKHGRD